jgi:hypothetical protein
MIGKVILLTFIVTGLNLGVPAVTAAETTVQRLDSINADPNANKTVVEQVYRLILKMVDRWNKHDLEGYMAGFWKSDDLLTVVESEVHWGWTDIYNNYARGYPDRKLMGQLDLQRLQVRSSGRLTFVCHRYHASAKICRRVADHSGAHQFCGAVASQEFWQKSPGGSILGGRLRKIGLSNAKVLRQNSVLHRELHVNPSHYF